MQSTVEHVATWPGKGVEPSAAAFLEACPDAVLATDAMLRPVGWNRRFAELWQLPADGGGLVVWRLVRAKLAERDAVLAAWRAAGVGAYVDTLELQDGRWVEVRTGPGEPYRLWFCRDVTERVRRDRGVSEGAARYRTLVEHSPDAIYLNRFGRDGRVYAESMNAEARALNDYDEAEALGRPLDEFLPEWLASIVLSAHETCRRTAQPVRYELLAPPGEDEDWARDCILMPVCDEAGQVVRTVLISRDVTQRRRQQQHLVRALAQAEAAEQQAELDRKMLIDAIEAIEDGFVMFDRDERLIRTNTAFLRGAGIATAEAAIGMSLEQIIQASIENGVLDPRAMSPEDYTAATLGVMRHGHGVTEVAVAKGRWLRIEPQHTSDGGIVVIVTDITAIKQREEQMAEAASRAESAERQAARAEARLVEAIETSPAAFMLFDREERLVLANSLCREMFPLAADLLQPGTRYEELLRRNLPAERDRIPPDELEALVAERLALFRAGRGSVERPMADGSWLRESDRRTPSGDIVSLRVDVTEGRVREKALAEASAAWTEREAQLRRIYANIPGVVYQVRTKPDRSLSFEYISERALDVFGVAAAAVQGDPELVLGRIRPADRIVFRETIDAAAAALAPWDCEFRIDTSSGTHWLRGAALPTALADGSVLWDGVLVDVTATKSAEADALDARRRLEDAIESLSEGFALFDITGKLVLANSRLREMQAAIDPAVELASGLDFEAVLRGLVAASRLEDVEAFVARRLEDYREGNGAWEVQLADGQWLQGTERRMRDGGMVAMRRDITLLKRREEQLRTAMIEATTANKAKSEFLANMSHELRTPLNAIIGFSEMISSEIFGPLGNARYGGYVTDIHSSGQHLLSIINTVLDLARVEAGKIVLSDGIVDVDALIGDCATLMRERCNRARLRLRLDVATDLPVLRADPVRLKQIVLNLLSNAIKFTKPHGQVTMRGARGVEGGIDIEIIDTGIGMDPRNIAQALEPFGLVHAAHSRAHEGTGLGLPLSKALIEEHGGQLVLTSALGVGTSALIKMPPDRIIRPMVRTEPAR